MHVVANLSASAHEQLRGSQITSAAGAEGIEGSAACPAETFSYRTFASARSENRADRRSPNTDRDEADSRLKAVVDLGERTRRGHERHRNNA